MARREQSQAKIAGLHPIVFITGMVSLLTDLSSQMIVPALPLFLTTVLHVQVAEIGVIEGIAESTASILKLFSGWISDRIGRRKPLMLAGYGFSNLIKPLFALTATWGQVLAIRFLDRFGSSPPCSLWGTRRMRSWCFGHRTWGWPVDWLRSPTLPSM